MSTDKNEISRQRIERATSSADSTKVTVSRVEPTPRKRKPAPRKPAVSEPKPHTLLELRFGRSSFVLSFLRHNKEAK